MSLIEQNEPTTDVALLLVLCDTIAEQIVVLTDEVHGMNGSISTLQTSVNDKLKQIADLRGQIQRIRNEINCGTILGEALPRAFLRGSR